MINAEIPFLTTIRDMIRSGLPIAEHHCQNEPDENVDAIAGDEHIIVIPNGITPGPRHNTSGGVWDLIFAARVVLFQKIANIPRDRRDNVFLNRLNGMDVRLGEIAELFDFSNPFLTNATTAANNDVRFIEPLKFQSMDARPIMVNFEPYDAVNFPNPNTSNTILAMKRGINFGGCRAMKGKD